MKLLSCDFELVMGWTLVWISRLGQLLTASKYIIR